MVSYCCVKGCSNNNKPKKKKTSSLLSFHSFPYNAELKTKWLQAIGRPNWDPPSHARVCSIHFNSDQLSYVRFQNRLLEDAVPTKNLPVNSNYEASNVKACRVCLATDVKLYSFIEDSLLRDCMESLATFNENFNTEGLPQCACFECAACLVKCNKLIEKTMLAQATLLDMFATNGRITKNLIKQLDRHKLNLTSSLNSYETRNYIYLKYNEKNNRYHKNYLEQNDNDVYFKPENKNADSLVVFKTDHESETSEHSLNIEETDYNEEYLELDMDSMAEDSMSDNDKDKTGENELNFKTDVENETSNYGPESNEENDYDEEYLDESLMDLLDENAMSDNDNIKTDENNFQWENANSEVNSNYEASNVKACRVCLATDVKLYSFIEDSLLRDCMESLARFNENFNTEGLPQYACFECAPCLVKCNKLIEKTMLAQATLLDIFATNGRITKNLIEQVDRHKLNLTSSLNSYETKNYIFLKYKEENIRYHKNYLEQNDVYLKPENEDADSLVNFKTDHEYEISGHNLENEEIDYIEEYLELDMDSVVEDSMSDNDKDKTEQNELDIKTDVENETSKYGPESNEENDYDEEYLDDSLMDLLDENAMSDNDNLKTENNCENQSGDGNSEELKQGGDTLKMEPDRIKSDDPAQEKADLHEYYDIVKLSGAEPLKMEPARIKSEDPAQEKAALHKYYDIVKLSGAKPLKRKSTRTKSEDPAREKADLHEYYDIVKLSLEEQIEDWRKTTARRALKSATLYECDTCFKVFAHVSTFKIHVSTHDTSRGNSECPVCKLRFKTDALTKAHANRAHARKFFCKSCPKVFKHVDAAKKHQRWHSDYTYKCSSCPFMADEESALSAHIRSEHTYMHVCSICGRTCVSRKGLKVHKATAHKDVQESDTTAYRCAGSNIDFASASAKRAHLLTSIQHKINTSESNTSREEHYLTCTKCGVKCTSRSMLIAHNRAKHPSATRRDWQRHDKYPTHCKICGETINSRWEHWQHVRKVHPKETDTYQAIITAVCDTCGKGYQNPTLLRLHQLRHGTPTVPCPNCPRLFYDKYTLARHFTTHDGLKPHKCHICGRAFKSRCNMERHTKVHSDVATYECEQCGKKLKYPSSLSLHIRTVHFKLPHPPRKKRTKPKKIEICNDGTE